MLADIIQELRVLYSKSSKHSNYQIISETLNKYLGIQDVYIKSRYEKERLNYILSELEIKDKIIMDVGGNTGYFTFELLNVGAEKIIYYEGNQEHCQFVKMGAELLNLQDRVIIKNNYFNFQEKEIVQKVDVVLLLNVLHHFGDDFGDKYSTLPYAKEQILGALRNLSNITEYLVFQVGFNWKGDKDFCLFENGTKKEMINFLRNGIKDYWIIKKIGIAQKINDVIDYVELDENNVARDDKLGEFLNRPLFLLKSIQNEKDRLLCR